MQNIRDQLKMHSDTGLRSKNTDLKAHKYFFKMHINKKLGGGNTQNQKLNHEHNQGFFS